MSRTQCYEWFKHFKEGSMSVGEDPRPGRPSTSTDNDHVERVHAVIRGNRLTVWEVADEVGISIGSCYQILTEKLQMHHVSTKFMPTGDEAWVYGYDVETKMQLLQWMGKGSPWPKKAQMSWSKIKEMLVLFFDWKGIVHHEFVSRGQMVNKQSYLEVLAHLRDAVHRKRPELWENHTCMLTATMRRLTHRSSSAVIWQNIRHPLCPSHPILRT